MPYGNAATVRSRMGFYRAWEKVDVLKYCAWGTSATLLGYHTVDVFQPPEVNIEQVRAKNVQPSISLTSRVMGLAYKLGLSNPEKLHVFISKGLSAMSAGSTSLLPHGLLGLPQTVLATSTTHPIMQGMKFRIPAGVRNQNIELVEEIEGQVRELMMWSTDMLNFTIAHELTHIVNNDTLYKAVEGPACILGAFHLYNTTARNIGWVVPKALFGLVVLPGLYFFLSTATNWRQEFRADRVAMEHGYGAGGVERIERKVLIDGLKAQVLVLKSAGTTDDFGASPGTAAQKKAKAMQGAGETPFGTKLGDFRRHPPNAWRVAALKGEQVGWQHAAYSCLLAFA